MRVLLNTAKDDKGLQCQIDVLNSAKNDKRLDNPNPNSGWIEFEFAHKFFMNLNFVFSKLMNLNFVFSK